MIATSAHYGRLIKAVHVALGLLTNVAHRLDHGYRKFSSVLWPSRHLARQDAAGAPQRCQGPVAVGHRSSRNLVVVLRSEYCT